MFYGKPLCRFKISAIAAFLCLTGSAGAGQSVISPYVPSPDVQQQAQSVSHWSELYSVRADEVPEAIRALYEDKVPPAPLGVAINDHLHLTVSGNQVVLAEKSFKATRGGKAILYKESCLVRPQKGDQWTLWYRTATGGATVSLTLAVLDHFAFGYTSSIAGVPELKRVYLKTAKDCGRLAESRVLLGGVLRGDFGPSAQVQQPVMLQAVQLVSGAPVAAFTPE